MTFTGQGLPFSSWGLSSMMVAGVMRPMSMAGEYTDRGLMEEPGWRLVSTGVFQPRFTVFSSVLPMATTRPLPLSTTEMADMSRWPVRLDTWSKFSRLLNTVSTAAWTVGS